MAEYTTKLQDHKVDAVAELKQLFEGTAGFIFTDYRGLNVEQITQLRGRLREKGASYKVIKNRYAKIAFGDLSFPNVDELLVGPTAVVLAGDESGAAAKVVVEFSEETPVSVKGAIIDGNVFDEAQVVDFSKLPGRDELIAKLMSAMNGSVTNFMYALQAVPSKLVRTLQAVADQKQEAGE